MALGIDGAFSSVAYGFIYNGEILNSKVQSLTDTDDIDGGQVHKYSLCPYLTSNKIKQHMITDTYMYVRLVCVRVLKKQGLLVVFELSPSHAN
jgi:hypothetical protein